MKASLVEKFHTICRTGQIERKLRFTAEFILSDGVWQKMIPAVRRGEKVEIGFDVPSVGDMQILNVNVPLGPMHARQDVRAFVDQLEAALAKGKTSVKVAVPNMIVREEYPDWAPQPTQREVGPSV
jgi:hypothetical protein